MRCLTAVMFATLIGSVALANDEPAGPPRFQPFRDPNWVAKIGRRGEVISEGKGPDPSALVSRSSFHYPEMIKLLKAGDRIGLTKMLESGSLALLPSGTPILVLEVHKNQFLADHTVIEARVTGGPSEGDKIFVKVDEVGRMISVEEQEEKAKLELAQKAKEKAREPVYAEVDAALKDAADAREREQAEAIAREKAKAEATLKNKRDRRTSPADPAKEAAKKADSKMAQALELRKSGNRVAALGYYREVVEKFPGTPQAKVAAEWIKSLAPKSNKR